MSTFEKVNWDEYQEQMKTLLSTILLSALCVSGGNRVIAQASIDLESGVIATGYNDVRISGSNGTLFSFKDDIPSNTQVFLRLRASYTINSRHTISALYAPLEIKSLGSVGNDLLFEGVLFPANTELNGSYKFNSYRLTYRYKIVDRPKIDFGLGFTAKIRDARIGLRSATQNSVKTNVGFVPIINFNLHWRVTDKFGLLLNGDALAAPQGRAEDVLIAGTYSISDYLMIRAGYRILEGGADNDEVYNFSLFHYASAGVTYTFNK